MTSHSGTSPRGSNLYRFFKNRDTLNQTINKSNQSIINPHSKLTLENIDNNDRTHIKHEYRFAKD